MFVDIKEIDVVILCGGLGTRLRPIVSDCPKVLAKIGEKTFLDILIDSLTKQGFNNIILCVGYLKGQIKNHFDCDKDYNIMFSEEKEPLGTGGALKKARSLIISNPFMVMNGDSICKIDFRKFYDFHVNKKALLSMALVRTKAAQDFGSVILDDSQRITSFMEKVVSKDECLINAGIYLMQKDVFSYMPDENRFSLEYDFFPKLIEDKCFGFTINSELIDIGTPERYEKAINIIGEII
ncbi:MAG: nucleotidyltransferase family protein [Candidatus Methanoperedens sp.]